MKFVKKIKIIKDGYKSKKVYIAGILVFYEKKTVFRRILSILGIPVVLYKNKLYKKEQIYENLKDFILCLDKQYLLDIKKNVLWIDHVYGGGTETYSQNKFSELKKECNFIRLQYNPSFNVYVISIPNKAVGYALDLESVSNLIYKVDWYEICVNSLVGWKDTLELIDLISQYKKCCSTTKISIRCHDFYAICPSYNLLNCDKSFCNLSCYPDGCSSCIERIESENKKNIDTMLLKESVDFGMWKNSWNDFFQNSVDEAIVFSHSSKELFTRAYPVLKKKINIVPHNTEQFPIVKIDKHKNINIAVLGNMSAFAKGGEVLRKMCELNTDPQLKFFVIGTYKKTPKGLIVSGKYNTKELPILIKKYEIDLVFISSVCPETFSYTTSEAMSMNIPVACYNFGAPAERVSMYKYGLVMSEINPQKNLYEIKDFIEKIRKGS